MVACDLTKVTNVQVDIDPEFSIPFAKFIFEKDQLISGLPDIDSFVVNNYPIENFLDIENADLNDFDFNNLIIYCENNFPFGISFEIQFIKISDSTAITQSITIANIEAATTVDSVSYSSTIPISPELLQDIKRSTGIKTLIVIDSLSNTIIESLTNKNKATLNMGITSVINYNDTLLISAQ